MLTVVGLGLMVSASQAQTFTVLKSFGVLTNVTGVYPRSELVRGPDSTLYGTANEGAGSVQGTVFKLELPPQFTAWQWGANGMQLQLSGESGHWIEIHASTNLTDWKLLATLLNASGEVGYVDMGAGNYPRRFYRVVQLP